MVAIDLAHYQVGGRMRVATEVVNVRVVAQLLLYILADEDLVATVDEACEAESGGQLHGDDVVQGADASVVVLIQGLVVLEHLVVEGIDKGEELLCLLVPQDDADRLKPEEAREDLSHVLEKFAVRPLRADHPG